MRNKINKLFIIKQIIIDNKSDLKSRTRFGVKANETRRRDLRKPVNVRGT